MIDYFLELFSIIITSNMGREAQSKECGMRPHGIRDDERMLHFIRNMGRILSTTHQGRVFAGIQIAIR